ncbi:UNVERIFIED_CONTAM: E3 ubiquitin-protein ligase HAKAI [Sesamum angustifolium]|uniref:E3 ubiquitin-protein ligase HAKAI n=1 Tax=Sesamum angustifolium TaxID=2727405 RepID=A0AAW2N5K0_9LAMI
MLQIRLSKPASETGTSTKPVHVDTVTVACPDHLVLADLPVAKGLGSASATAVIKTVGRRSRRQLGERVHFCVRCDFPIAIYGRLSPCEHAFCLDCARSDSLCYLFDSSSSPRPVFSPSSNSQVPDRENKTQRPQSRDQPPSRTVMQPRPVPPFSGQTPNHPSEQLPDSNQPHVFDGAASQNRFPQQSFDPQGQGGLQQDSGLAPPQLGYAPYASGGTQQFFGPPYEMARPDATPEAGSGHGSLLGFPPGPAGPMNFPQNYPQPWNMGPAPGPLEPPLVSQGTTDGFMNVDPQGRGFFQGDYGQNVGILPSNLPPPAANMGVEQRQGGKFVDPRDGKGILAAQPLPLPPPPPIPPPHLTQLQRGRSYSGDGNHDAPPGFGWQPET